MLEIDYELAHPLGKEPVRASSGSAAWDAFACIEGRMVEVYGSGSRDPFVVEVTDGSFLLQPGFRASIPLGIKLHFPRDYQCNVLPRSGRARKEGLTVINSPGLGDADYPEEYLAFVVNHGAFPVRIGHGDRVAQLNFQRFEEVEFVKGRVVQTTSRSGGSGHTGL